MRTRQTLIDIIYHLITLRKMGFSEEMIQLEMQECEHISIKKLYRKYIIMYKRFCNVYPEYA